MLEECALLQKGTIDGDHDEREQLKVEEIVNRIIGSTCAAKLKFSGLFSLLVLTTLTSPLLVYIPVFAGYIPYNEWVCVSDRCSDLLLQSNKTAVEFYGRASMCDNKLVPRVDFNWTSHKTYYSLDWNLICEDEAKGSSLQSFFFFGAFTGLVLGSLFFDRIGRKTTTIVGICVCVVSTAATFFVGDYYTMLALRFVQGLGAFVVRSGAYMLSLEYTPTNFRNLVQVGNSITWGAGAFCCIAISYFAQSWQMVFLIVGILILLLSVPFFFFPESPRFHLIKGQEDDARRTIMRVSHIFKQPFDISEVDLVYQDYKQSSFEQIGDFVKYPIMGKNTIILFASYIILAAMSYGILFSWSKLGKDIYMTIILASLAVLVGQVTGYDYFIRERLGRKRALILNMSLVSLGFFCAIPKVQISGTWNSQLVMCLVTRPFIGSCWSCSRLLVGELSPTTHRGMVLTLTSAAARIGAFVGPYFALLYNIMDASWVLCLFGAAAAFTAIFLCFLEDSTGKPIPATPADIPAGTNGFPDARAI